jgi:hypothetical protein
MRPLLMMLQTALVAGCVAQTPARDADVTIAFQGETYPVERLESFPEKWRVLTPAGPVPCRAPTEQDCYWSLRAYLLSQGTPDLIGS